jgi:DNA polymerase elongation subunit (family B)
MARTAYGYCVIDIETANAPEEEVKAWFDSTWKAPSNYKDAKKIEEARAKAWESCQEKAALLPSAPIIAIGVKSETELRCVHCMWEHEPLLRMNGLVQGFADEGTMLAALSALFALKVDAETVLAGFNIRSFDFPRIRLKMARRKMPIPAELLSPEQTVFDNMEKYCRLFSGERDIMCSCPEVSVALGIVPHHVSGAIVPQLYEAREYEMVVDKVLLDVIEEEEQFKRMCGRA